MADDQGALAREASAGWKLPFAVKEKTMADEGLIAVVKELGDVIARLLKQLEEQERLVRIADEFSPVGESYREQAR